MSQEVLKSSGEHSVEVQNEAAKQAEKLRNAESSVEQSPELKAERQEKARSEAEAVFAKEAGKERRSAAIDGDSPRAVQKVDKLAKKHAFSSTMKHIQAEMSAPSRAFSKVIHAPFVEKSSEILGSSLARPNAVLAGSFSALVLVTIIYVVSRTFGYRLSGFETIAAFTLGWALGIIYDYIRIMASGKRSL